MILKYLQLPNKDGIDLVMDDERKKMKNYSLEYKISLKPT